MSLRQSIVNNVVQLLPPTRAYKLKVRLWRWAGVSIAADARLVSSVRIWTSGTVFIGEDTFMGHEVMVVGGGAPVVIGARCDIAPRVIFVAGSHLDGGEERAAGEGVSHPISVGDGVWIGTGTTVLGNVEIGDGAIIGAGSLVNKAVPPRVIAGGVPCRVIRNRAF